MSIPNDSAGRSQLIPAAASGEADACHLLCVLGPFGDHDEAQSYPLSRTDLDELHTVAMPLLSIVEDADPPARATGQ